MQHNKNSRSGWREAEEALLFDEVRAGRDGGKPLKTVFEQVAEKTGRRPNSVRNYYYARVRARGVDEPQGGAFVPFSEEEIGALLRTVLTAQANGISVRACTLAMGGGDTRAMLRYQNKYRSLVKGRPERVREVMRELEAEGAPRFDPYETFGKRKGGRPRRDAGRLAEAVCGVASELERVQGLDVSAFFESLGTLATSAVRGAAARESGASLRERERQLEAEIAAQQERFRALLGMYRQLMSVNREFLGRNGANRQDSLAEYILRLSSSVADSERALAEYSG